MSIKHLKASGLYDSALSPIMLFAHAQPPGILLLPFMLFRSFFRYVVLISSAAVLAQSVAANDLKLPDLGDPSTGLISPRQEYELGQNWLRAYRAQVPTSTDPFLQMYVESLTRNLAAYSELNDKRLDVLVVKNPTLNAFAVPGGVIGVHTGLFTYASTEDQFASVIAHELAHLSQRHFARRLVEEKDKAIPNMAALLASILIAATAGGDAGIAAISATQAAALDSRLRFSRQMEQEADRIGMTTLVRAGRNPQGMPDMFQGMLRASRYSRRPPEFLLTHPLTESRVSDSQLRAQQYPLRYHPPSEAYQLARIRATLLHESNMQYAVRLFESELKGNKFSETAARYGLTLALTQANKLKKAEKTLAPLLKADPDNLHFVIADADIDAARENFEVALEKLTRYRLRYPDHHALNVRLAEVLMKARQYKQCQEVLLAHSERRPKDDYVWYLLAEVHGLVGNIFEVHSARAEYFMLNGLYDKAIIQLKNARLLRSEDKHALAKIDERLKKARRLRDTGRL